MESIVFYQIQVNISRKRINTAVIVHGTTAGKTQNWFLIPFNDRPAGVAFIATTISRCVQRWTVNKLWNWRFTQVHIILNTQR
jgi:hypothetical protein